MDISQPRILRSTPWKAPEVRDKKLADGALADIYSYGCVLLNLVDKDEPFEVEKRSGDLVFDDFISCCLEEDPQNRLKKPLEHEYLRIENPTPLFIPGVFAIPEKKEPEDEIDAYGKKEEAFGMPKEAGQIICNESLSRFPSVKTYKSFTALN